MVVSPAHGLRSTHGVRQFTVNLLCQRYVRVRIVVKKYGMRRVSTAPVSKHDAFHLGMFSVRIFIYGTLW